MFDLTAYVWEAAPCSILPTADENAVTESTVTTVSFSLFQSATVLTKNELLYCCLEFEATGVANFVSGDGVVRITILEGGRAYSSSISVCWHQEALWRHGWDVSLHNLVEAGC